MEQLRVYHRMLQSSDDRAADKVYQSWLKDRFTGDAWTWESRGAQSKL